MKEPQQEQPPRSDSTDLRTRRILVSGAPTVARRERVHIETTARTTWRAFQVAAAVTTLTAALVGCRGSGVDKAGGGGHAKPIVLTLATANAGGSDVEFQRAVERLSGGSIRIQVRGRWRFAELGSDRGIVEDVRAGKADLGDVGARVWDTLGVSSFQALLAPFLVDSLELERRVLASRLADRMLAGTTRFGVVGLALSAGALRRPSGISRPVAPRDYLPDRVRIRLGGVAVKTFYALGDTALEGYELGLSSLDGAGLSSRVHAVFGCWREVEPEVIANSPYCRPPRTLTSNVVLWPLVGTIVMNRAAFDALTFPQQALLRRAGREAAERAFARLERDEQRGVESLCRPGGLDLVNASAADLAALRSAARPVYDALERDPLTQKLIAAIREMRDALPRSRSTLTCSGAQAKAVADASQLEGRWRWNLLPSDLIAVGDPPPIAREMSGSWTVEFTEGRFVAQQLETGAIWRGAYGIDGDVLRAVFEECPVLECGGLIEMKWSVYRDKLTLALIPGSPSASVLVAKSLERVR